MLGLERAFIRGCKGWGGEQLSNKGRNMETKRNRRQCRKKIKDRRMKETKRLATEEEKEEEAAGEEREGAGEERGEKKRKKRSRNGKKREERQEEKGNKYFPPSCLMSFELSHFWCYVCFAGRG